MCNSHRSLYLSQMRLFVHIFAGFRRKKRSSDFLDFLCSGPRRVTPVLRTNNPEVKEGMSSCDNCAPFLRPYEGLLVDGKKVDFFNPTGKPEKHLT